MMPVASKKPKLKTRTSALYEAILNTLNVMPARNDPNIAVCKEGPTFITKWIDYSNKYGFGYQLSDQSVGVIFNDSTQRNSTYFDGNLDSTHKASARDQNDFLVVRHKL